MPVLTLQTVYEAMWLKLRTNFHEDQMEIREGISGKAGSLRDVLSLRCYLKSGLIGICYLICYATRLDGTDNCVSRQVFMAAHGNSS